MLSSSDDDDLPDVPTVEECTPAPHTAASSSQADRFQELEELHRDIQNGGAPSRHREAKTTSTTTTTTTTTLVPTPADVAAPGVWTETEEGAFYELRSLAPHLSPRFSCSYSDAVLLIAAIHNGGAVASERQTLADRCQSLEADRRQLEQRLERARESCDAFRDEVAASKQKLKAVQEEAKSSVAVLAQRREEMRKQLLLEETRSEKLKVRNRKLELENEALKERMRGQLR